MGLREPLESRMGFAAVRWADKQRHRALQMPCCWKGIGVALKGQFVVQAGQHVEFGDAVFPTILGPRAGRFQLGEGLRRRAFGLQSRQQGFEMFDMPRSAARQQQLQMFEQFLGLCKGRCRPDRGLQRCQVAIAIEIPDGRIVDGHAESDRQLPTRLRQLQGMAAQALPNLACACQPERFQLSAALLHQRTHGRGVAHRVEVDQGVCHQARFDPAARA